MGWWHNSAAIEILQKIADNTSRHKTMWIAIIGAAAGLIGAAIGGAGGYFGVKRTTASHERIETARMRVEVVTAERLRWLQDLRQRLSQLYVEMDMQYNILQRPVPIGGAAAVQAEHDAMSRKVMEQCNMIMLMLNPARQQQEALRQALTQALAFMMAASETTARRRRRRMRRI
jgi:hypothetical protein